MHFSKINRFALLSTAVCLLAVMLWPGLLMYSHWFFGAIVLSVGIPHGAVDHLIDWKTRQVSLRQRLHFFIKYLGLMSLFAVVWYFFPQYAFIGFLLLSSFHFGQSQLYYLQLPQWLKYVVFTSWGVLLLSVIVYLNFLECQAIFSSLSYVNVTVWLTPELLQVLISLCTVCTVGGYFLGNTSRNYSNNLLLEFSCLSLLFLSATFTNAIFTFALYFGIWHSIRSMAQEYESIHHITPTITHFIKSLLPFTFVAISGMLILFLLLREFHPGISPYMIFIVIISALTLPHLIIMDEVYENAISE